MRLDCDFSVQPDINDYDKIHIIVDVSIPRGLIYHILVGVGVIQPNNIAIGRDDAESKEG